MKSGRLKVPLQSKYPGVEKKTQRRVGTRCTAERHKTEPGRWVVWFGREYAVIDAIELHNMIEFDTPFAV